MELKTIVAIVLVVVIVGGDSFILISKFLPYYNHFLFIMQ